MKYRIIAVAVIFAVLASVIPVGCMGPGEEAPEFMIYEVKPVTVSTEDVQNLALTLFALDETPPVNETPELYYVTVEPLYLECCKNSGSIWYADNSMLYSERYMEELPSTEEARAIADDFLVSLSAQGVIPEGVKFKFLDIGETQTVTFDRAINGPETVINHLDVLYDGFEDLEGIPVEGPGAKIRVSIGDNGEIIGLHYVWREIESLETYPAITEDEAIEILKEKLEAEPEELEVRLAYYAESEFTKQDFLQPYYICDGTVITEEEEVHFKTQLIPATTFSPIARIVSPDNGTEFPEGTMISFDSYFSGGEPPYEYIWESNIDGVIGTEASISSALSVGTRDEEILPHTIKLKVIDQNGNQDIDLISVKVNPSSPMVSALEGIQTLSTGSPRDDANDKELGIEWVNAYGSKGTLSNNDDNARGFGTFLGLAGWVSQFDWGDQWAWEQDFKYLEGTGGGTDFIWIDTVDFGFFSGHGDATYILFKNSVDYQKFYFERARWGGDAGGTSGEEGDLEWIALDACLTLKASHVSSYDVFSRWDQAFDGLHYVLGFDTGCTDVPNRGSIFALYMFLGWPVRKAWIRATQATQSSTCRGAYLRAGTSGAQTLDDHLPGRGYVSPDPYPWTYLAYCRWSC